MEIPVKTLAAILALAVAISGVLVTFAAEAAPRSHYKGRSAYGYRSAAPNSSRGSGGYNPGYSSQPTDRGYEAARANDLDPAGNYKGYPDWARSAFSNGKGF